MLITAIHVRVCRSDTCQVQRNLILAPARLDVNTSHAASQDLIKKRNITFHLIIDVLKYNLALNNGQRTDS